MSAPTLLEALPHRRRLADAACTAAGWAMGLAGILLPVSIVAYLLAKGLEHVSWNFLFDVPRGFPVGSGGGIGPAILGSLALTGLGLLFAWPLGVASALFLAEYAPRKRWPSWFRFGFECLAAVPSILYGLFGYAFLVVFLNFKISLLSGGLTLGFVMLPVILIGAQEAFESAGGAYHEAGLGLGISKWYLVRRVLLPGAMPGILAATVLAAGHAVGSAAPVLFTASVVYSRGGMDLSRPVMTLPTHLYYLVSEAVSFPNAYGTALVLVAGLLCTNGAAMALRLWMARTKA